jgi:hypothetical protein
MYPYGTTHNYTHKQEGVNTMATITELVSTNTSAVVTIFEASATINDIPFTAYGKSGIEAFLNLSSKVEFFFGQVISLGIEYK